MTGHACAWDPTEAGEQASAAQGLTDFLWYVRVAIVLGRSARMSHSRIVLSCDPVMTCSPRSSCISMLPKSL